MEGNWGLMRSVELHGGLWDLANRLDLSEEAPRVKGNYQRTEECES